MGLQSDVAASTIPTFEANQLQIGQVLLRGARGTNECSFGAHILRIQAIRGHQRTVVLRSNAACELVVDRLEIEARTVKTLTAGNDKSGKVSKLPWTASRRDS